MLGRVRAQFHLRTALLGVTVCCVLLGVARWATRGIRAQAAERRAIQTIERLGGIVLQLGAGWSARDSELITIVDLSEWTGSDADLHLLDGIPEINHLTVTPNSLTPAAVERLERLASLETLTLSGQSVDPTILAQLRRTVPRLEVIVYVCQAD